MFCIGNWSIIFMVVYGILRTGMILEKYQGCSYLKVL